MNSCVERPELKERCRYIISNFLSRCSLIYPHDPIDHRFIQDCCDEAIKRGYPMDGQESLRPYIPGGAIMAMTGYAHLPDDDARVAIALYTACGIYLDDVFNQDVCKISDFSHKFIHNVPHEDSVCEAFADILRKMTRHFSPCVSSMIVVSTLNAVAALLLEHETKDLQLSTNASNYPAYIRAMSGAAEAYALFAFPSHIPLGSYIQSLPDIAIYINNGNDIYSFYKEELAGESVNHVSLQAAWSNRDKIDVLKSIVDDAIAANNRVLHTLGPRQEAYAAYTHFCQGFIGFHAALRRYKLDDLAL